MFFTRRAVILISVLNQAGLFASTLSHMISTRVILPRILRTLADPTKAASITPGHASIHPSLGASGAIVGHDPSSFGPHSAYGVLLVWCCGNDGSRNARDQHIPNIPPDGTVPYNIWICGHCGTRHPGCPPGMEVRDVHLSHCRSN